MGNWDNQIDDVARQMTEGGPGGSFTARVLTRVDRRDPRPWVRRVVWRWSPVVVAVATALALVIALARWNLRDGPAEAGHYGRLGRHDGR